MLHLEDRLRIAIVAGAGVQATPRQVKIITDTLVTLRKLLASPAALNRRERALAARVIRSFSELG